MHRRINTQRGFTIFEALIYIALFAFLIGGGVISAFNLFAGSAAIKDNTQSEMELNFVLRKLDWVLSDSTILNPSSGNNDDTLIVNKGGSQYLVTVDGTDTMSITTGGTQYPLTTNRLDITNLDFEHVAGTPNVMNVTMTVNGRDIGPITRYVRTD